MDFEDYAIWDNRLAVYDMENKSYKKLSSVSILRYDIKSGSIAVVDGKNKLWMGFNANQIDNIDNLENVSSRLSMNVQDAKFISQDRLAVYGEDGQKSCLAIVSRD